MGVELFLIDKEDRRFKSTVVHEPYFFLIPKERTAKTGTHDGSGGGAADDGGSDERELRS